MSRTPVRTQQYPQATTLTAGPYIGVCDSTDPTTAQPNKARQAINCYRKPGPSGGAFIGRPGTSLMAGSWGTNVQAGPMDWTTFAGVALTVGVADGVVKTYDFDSDTLSVALTQAEIIAAVGDKTGPAINGALSLAARCALVPFADGLVISDGLHLMLFWDGTPHGGLTVMDYAPIAFGKPGVYASKLMVIDAATQRSLYWSEEGQPNVGYAATIGGLTYPDAWDNVGGFTEPMIAAVGTNEALYIYRARTTLAVTGAVGTDFATAHTKANISPLYGTVSPWAIVETPNGILAPDADGQPRLFHYGNPTPLDLSIDSGEAIRLVPRLSLPDALAVIDQATETVLVLLPQSSDSLPTLWLCYALTDLQYQGTWDYQGAVSSVGIVRDSQGVRRVAHSEAIGGRCLAHGDPQNGPWYDVVQGLVSGIPNRGIGPKLGYDPEQECTVDRIEVAFSEPSTSIGIGYETSRGTSAPKYQSVGIAGGASLWGVAQWGVDRWGSANGTGGKIHQGKAGLGNYVAVTWDHSVPGEAFGMTAIRVTGAFRQGNPKAA